MKFVSSNTLKGTALLFASRKISIEGEIPRAKFPTGMLKSSAMREIEMI